jgi:thioesterase domain-containing protein
MVVEHAPTGIQLRFFGWVDQTASDLGKVRSEAIRMAKAAYARAGIEAPRTVHHVVLSRETVRHDQAAVVEPSHAIGADTSVNRDIDTQLADAQRADDSRNLLHIEGNDA